MPLLRLASLIFASLLVAALSALVPTPANRPLSVANQSPAAVSTSALVAETALPAARLAQGIPFSSLRQQRPELARMPGQSVPETGQ